MKGMQQIIRGKGFKGLLEYLIYRDDPKKEKGRVLGGNMDGDTPKELSDQFNTTRHFRNQILNRPVEKPVWHNSLRLPKGETLSDEKWLEIADVYMKRMGFSDNHQRSYIQHNDKNGQHIHIIANRIALDGSLYYGKNENLISTRLIAELEKEHGLSITKGPLLDKNTGKISMPERRNAKKNEIEMQVRKGSLTEIQLPVREQLQSKIQEALSARPGLEGMIQRLQQQRITVRINKASTGRINGCSFELDGISFKGSQLGDAFKWNRLQQQLVFENEHAPPLPSNTKVSVPQSLQIELNNQSDINSKPKIPDWKDSDTALNTIKAALEQSTQYCPNFKTFIERLDQAGVTALPSGKSGIPQGMSFEHEGFTFKGSDVGYPWRNLSQLTAFTPQDVFIIDRLRKRKKELSEDNSYGVVTPEPNSTRKPSEARVFMITRIRWYQWQESFTQPEKSPYGDWRWTKSGVKAFTTSSHAINCYSMNDKAIRAAMIVALKQFGSVHTTGTDAFGRKAWLLAQEMGLEITGYNPTGHDLLIAKTQQITYQMRHPSTSHTKPRANYERYRPPRPPASSNTQRADTVQTMPTRNVEDYGSRSTMLLPNNASGHLEDRRNKPGQTLQRPIDAVNDNSDFDQTP